MECTSCKARINTPDAMFCPVCGASLQQETPSQNIAQAPMPSQDGEQVHASAQVHYSNQIYPQNQSPYRPSEPVYQQQYIPPNQTDIPPYNVRKKHSGMSIAALVISLFGCFGIVGLILGIIDLASGKSDKKHGLSYVAIAIGSLMLVFSVAALFFVSNYSSNTANRSESESVVVSSSSESSTAMSDKSSITASGNASDTMKTESSTASSSGSSTAASRESSIVASSGSSIAATSDILASDSKDETASAESSIASTDNVVENRNASAESNSNSIDNNNSQEQESASASGYESIYNDYSQRIQNAVPGLIEEYKSETAGITDIEKKAEICNSKIEVLADIANTGVLEMAEHMYKSNGFNKYENYETWSQKLLNLYMSEGEKITDVYMSSFGF